MSDEPTKIDIEDMAEYDIKPVDLSQLLGSPKELVKFEVEYWMHSYPPYKGQKVRIRNGDDIVEGVVVSVEGDNITLGELVWSTVNG